MINTLYSSVTATSFQSAQGRVTYSNNSPALFSLAINKFIKLCVSVSVSESEWVAMKLYVCVYACVGGWKRDPKEGVSGHVWMSTLRSRRAMTLPSLYTPVAPLFNRTPFFSRLFFPTTSSISHLANLSIFSLAHFTHSSLSSCLTLTKSSSILLRAPIDSSVPGQSNHAILTRPFHSPRRNRPGLRRRRRVRRWIWRWTILRHRHDH